MPLKPGTCTLCCTVGLHFGPRPGTSCTVFPIGHDGVIGVLPITLTGVIGVGALLFRYASSGGGPLGGLGTGGGPLGGLGTGGGSLGGLGTGGGSLRGLGGGPTGGLGTKRPPCAGVNGAKPTTFIGVLGALPSTTDEVVAPLLLAPMLASGT